MWKPKDCLSRKVIQWQPYTVCSGRVKERHEASMLNFASNQNGEHSVTIFYRTQPKGFVSVIDCIQRHTSPNPRRDQARGSKKDMPRQQFEACLEPDGK